MQPIDSIETYAYGTSKDLVSTKEDIKCNNIIRRHKMINFDVTRETIKENNPNWPQIPHYLYRILIILIIWDSGSNSQFNLINHQPDIDKIYLYAQDPYEAKYQFLINKRESTSIKHFVLSQLVTNVTFCNKKPKAFCNKLFSYFLVIK